MKHCENIEDDCDEKQRLVVPLFPDRKKPSIEISKSSCQSSQSTQINEYRSMPNSHQKRGLEMRIMSTFAKESSHLKYVVNAEWATQYQKYLYENGQRPGPINNADLKDHILVNEKVWHFLKEEYQGGPEMIKTRNGDKRSRTIEPVIQKQHHSLIKQMPYDVPLIGMKNESYFCYLHAGLQCLLSMRDINMCIMRIVRQVLKVTQSKKTLSLIQFNRAYLELIDQLQSATSPIKVRSLKFLMINKFHPKNQHDCHEMLLYLLGQLDEEITAINKEFHKTNRLQYINYVDKFCKGKLQTQIICQTCNHLTKVTEPFTTLSLALTHSKTLEQCLEEYTREESIKDYRCSKCANIQIKKQTKIVELPTIFIFHLKRFQFFPQLHKNNKPIQYPLDVLQIKNRTYRLKGVIIHTGSITSGHYYSICKRYNNWYLFNDDIVTQVSKRECLCQMAYMLFYQLNEQS